VPVNQNPTVALTAPAANATYVAGSSISLSASATDSDGQVAKVEFFAGSTKIGEKATAPYTVSWGNLAAGSYQLTAKATDDKGGVTTSAPISVTVSPKNQLPTVSLAVSAGSVAQNSVVTISANASDSDGSVSKVEFFANSTKIGEKTSAPFSIDWTAATVGTVALTAKVTDNQGGVTTSTSVNLNVTVIPVNQAPSVSLTAPTNNAKLTEGDNVTLTASATDSDGQVAKVEFFAGSTKIGEKTAAPFTMDWNNLPVGTYAVTARATDDKGVMTTSSAVTVLVEAKVIPNQNPVISIVAPAANATFTEGDNLTVTVDVKDSDGSVAKVEYFAGTTKLGESTTLPFSFNWTNLKVGSYSITAKATDDKGAAVTSSAIAITITAKVVPNQAPLVSVTAPTNNTTSVEGDAIAITADASDADGSVSKVEFFANSIKIGEKTNAPFTITWTGAAAGTYSLTAKATDNKGAEKTSTAVAVTVTKKVVTDTTANENPVVALTEPIANSTFTEGETVKLTATASDADGSVAKIEFYAENVKIGEATTAPYTINWTNVAKGTYSITAKATDNQDGTAVSTASSITVTAKPNQNPSIAISSPAGNASFTEGESVTISVNATDSDGSIAKVEFFAGTTKIGETTTAPFAFNWTNLGTGTYSLTAKATDNQNGSVTSEAVSVTVKAKPAPVPAPNSAPVVSLTAPTANASFTEGDNIALTASATDSDGSIAKVEFFAGSTKIGEKTTASFTITWNTVATGNYSLTAKATDDKGLATISAAVAIVVKAKVAPAPAPTPNSAPVVSLTAPANNAKYTEGTTITLTASASDADGSVSKMEFFNGTTKLGEKTAAPFAMEWTSVATGTYTLTAKATDNQGTSSTSTSITVVVEAKPVAPRPAPNQLPTVALTSPASGASYTEGNTVTITAAASDADGSVSKVEFFANSIKIGEKTNAPFTITWTAVAGSQSITAKVTDNANAVATSAAVAVTVNAVPPPPVENKLPIVAISSPAVNARFTEGNTISITASATDSDGSIAKVEFFAGSTKIGEKTAAPYSVSWTKVARGNYALTAVATDNKGGKTTSAAVSIAVVAAPVVVTPAPPAANQVPTVRLSSPTANGTYTTAQTVPLVADAKDADGSVSKVEFFANESKIGEKTAAPYSMSTTLKAGSYSLTAVATDNKGSSATSAAITINVTQPVANNPQTAPAPNKAPVVSITAPVTNAKYTKGAKATLTASATDSDGSIAKVEFFAGTTKIGEKTAAPFTVDWANLAVGTYTVTAKATDNKNAATTSAAITIIVEAKPVVVAPAPPAPTPAPAPVTPPAPVATTPTFFRAINLNGPSMEIDGNKWGGSDAANYTYSGTSMNKPTITLNPTTDKNRTAMIQSAITGRNVTLAMTSVPNATYDVYLYVWEDDATQTYSVYLEGKAVQVNYTSGAAGTWKRLGPFRQTITDKNINITTSGGAANVSGIEVWQVPAQQALATNCSATGNILYEAWQNVAADMSTMIPAYKKPDNSTQLTVFEAPTNVGDNYSSRIRGYICPPATGSYTFWISGDAEAELWLGLNEDPATKTKIAYVDGATNPREWNKSATQQSAPIQLEKGKKYYIEAVHKAGTGNDHLAVGWQMPGGIQEMPLAGVRLSPYVPTEKEFELPALEGGKVALFPNPAAEQTNVRFSVNEDQDAVITVTNLSAQQVVSMTEPVRSGENVVPIAVAGLSKGVYVVTVQVKEGRLSQKLIVTQ
jgi:chitodextrinase